MRDLTLPAPINMTVGYNFGITRWGPQLMVGTLFFSNVIMCSRLCRSRQKKGNYILVVLFLMYRGRNTLLRNHWQLSVRRRV